jgi:SAM-dependent methyltransferase
VDRGSLAPAPLAEPGDWHAYRPFPDAPGRNGRQAAIEIPLLVRALGLHPGGRVLEIGCGRGVALPALHRLLRPARLVGLDIDGRLLAEARARVSAHGVPARLLRGDARRPPLPAGAFDLVLDFGTCYHISYPERALREVARLLAPGGVFVEETRLSQLLSHPVRSFGRSLPWARVPELRRVRTGLLWASYTRDAAVPADLSTRHDEYAVSGDRPARVAEPRPRRGGTR